MDEVDLEARLDSISSAVTSGRMRAAYELATAAEAELGPGADPTLCGWIHFYRVRTAHALKRWDDAWAALRPHVPVSLPPENAAWLMSAGAEIAAELGMPDEVVAHAERCVAMRREAGDHAGARMAARTACELLRRIDQSAFNTPFLPIVIDEARNARDDETALFGYLYSVLNIGATGNPIRIDTLIDSLDWLEARRADRRAKVVLEFLAKPAAAKRRTERKAAAVLCAASAAGDLEALASFVASGSDPDGFAAHAVTPLFAASLAGQLEVARWLLVRGVAQRPNTDGRGPLHAAADEGHAAVCTLLLEHGAAVDARDGNAQTPLHVAGWQDHVTVVRVLFAAGADAAALDRTGNTPFSLAATENVPATLAAFLDAGVPLDQRNARGWTPLMSAANAGRAASVVALLARGADRDAADAHGRTARSLAHEAGHTEVVGLLENRARP